MGCFEFFHSCCIAIDGGVLSNCSAILWCKSSSSVFSLNSSASCCRSKSFTALLFISLTILTGNPVSSDAGSLFDGLRYSLLGNLTLIDFYPHADTSIPPSAYFKGQLKRFFDLAFYSIDILYWLQNNKI